MITYHTKKGDRFEYNPRESKFVKPEIQGLLEISLKAGLVDLQSTGGKFKSTLLVLCNLGFIVLDISTVSSELSQLGFVDFISLVNCQIKKGQNTTDELHRYLIQVEYSTMDRVWKFGFSVRKLFEEWVGLLTEASNALKQ